MSLPLTPDERARLRTARIRLADVPALPVDRLAAALEVPAARARDLRALAIFQTVPSLGPRFAADLLALGHHSLADLRGRSGAGLLDAHERHVGYRTDPCVEDQLRLAAYVAATGRHDRTWPAFTAERKASRGEHGYPADRPRTHWTEVAARA